MYREEDNFQFKPAIDSQSNLEPSIITVIYLNEVWIIDGTVENEISERVKKIIKLNELISVPNVAS